MGTLLKYEIKKSKLMFLITAIIIGLLELLWMVGYVGTTATDDKYEIFTMIFAFSTAFLVFAAIMAMFIGVLYSVMLYNNEVQKKSGYMLFLTPTPTWKWVLSKVLLGVIATAVLLLVFAVLGVTDILLVIKEANPDTVLGTFLTPIKALLQDNVLEWILILVNILFQIVSMTTTIFLAIALARTLLGNKKIGGFIAFLFWIALNMVQSAASSLIMLVSDDMISMQVEADIEGFRYIMDSSIPVFLMTLALNLIFAGVCYFVTVYLTDKKMSF